MTTNKELRELAEKATPGEWTTDSDVAVIAAGSDQLNNGYGICDCHGPESRKNVNFIAAASPATVLALLDDLKALQAERDALVGALESALGSFDDWCEGQDPSDIADAIDTFPWVMQARAALAAHRKGGDA